MKGGGTLVAFRVGGGRADAFAVLNRLQLIKISNNLGDAKSLITHPASTTHSKIAPAERLSVGITEDLLRLSVGLEDCRRSAGRSGASRNARGTRSGHQRTAESVP